MDELRVKSFSPKKSQFYGRRRYEVGRRDHVNNGDLHLSSQPRDASGFPFTIDLLLDASQPLFLLMQLLTILGGDDLNFDQRALTPQRRDHEQRAGRPMIAEIF